MYKLLSTLKNIQREQRNDPPTPPPPNLTLRLFVLFNYVRVRFSYFSSFQSEGEGRRVGRRWTDYFPKEYNFLRVQK